MLENSCGDLRAAIKHLERAVQLDETNIPARLMMLGTYMELGEYRYD